MKKGISILLLIAAMLSLASCGSGAAAPKQTAQPTPAAETAAPVELAAEEAPTATEESTESKALVIYFAVAENAGVVDAVTSASINPDSDPVHGYTRTVADWAADYLGADTFSVQTVFNYPTEYQPTTDIALTEQRNNERPELETEIENLDAYDTVVIVTPVWWGDIPMAMYTLFDSYDFSGKDLVVFITHYGSRFGRCVQTIRALEPEATVYEGLAIDQTQVAGAQNDVIARLQELGY